MPAHAGLIALRDRLQHPATDAAALAEASQLMAAPTLGPYSLYRGVGGALARLVGPLAAVRALATLAWFGLPLSLAFARWRLWGRWLPRDLWTGLALGLGLTTLLGLTSFQLGAALLLVANAEWLHVLGRPTRAGLWRVSALACLVFVAHGFAFVLLALLAMVAWRTFSPRRPGSWAAWVPPAVVASAAWWAAHRIHVTTPAVSWLPRYEPLSAKLALLSSPTLFSRYGVDAAVSLVLWTLAGAALWRSRAAGGVVRALRWQALALVLGFALAPHAIGWFGFIDARLLPSALALALLLPVGARGPSDRLLAASAWIVVGTALVAVLHFTDEARGWQMVTRIPAGSRVLHVPMAPDSRHLAVHPFLHYDKLALIDRPMVVSDLWFHQGSAVYPRATHPALRLPRSRYAIPDPFAWTAVALAEWDYVLVRTTPDHPPPRLPDGLSLLAHEGGFWLYRVTKAE